MSVELPFAPVDAIIRRHAGNLRVSADAAEALAVHIQDEGADRAQAAAERAVADDRKTIQANDFDRGIPPSQSSVSLPIAPVDRIARLRIDDRFRVGRDARTALAAVLEDYANEAAAGAAVLARHAGRKTIQAEDVETYFELVE